MQPQMQQPQMQMQQPQMRQQQPQAMPVNASSKASDYLGSPAPSQVQPQAAMAMPEQVFAMKPSDDDSIELD